jgi:hypothetical protein
MAPRSSVCSQPCASGAFPVASGLRCYPFITQQLRVQIDLSHREGFTAVGMHHFHLHPGSGLPTVDAQLGCGSSGSVWVM